MRPAFDLLFGVLHFFGTAKLLCPNQPNGAPGESIVFWIGALLMLCQTLFKVRGCACVIRAVSAFDDINPVIAIGHMFGVIA